ncbi:hypothetical protein [Streptomyces sp. NBC_00228]|uniref:hypothetical protein n=1 Tax=Streptomyces sp. NBC_00228 TaxID=2903637 RepID=UPI002E2A1491|nr:hypothetical protein [Streptomyces sp. NBC_00228]
MVPRLKKALRVPTPADRGPGRPWRAGSPPAPIDPDLPSEMALRTAREVKAHAPHCRVVFTVYEMKRLGRDAAELTAARKGKHGGRPPSSPTTCSTPCAGAAQAASPSR